jgi:hypothetical protein
MTQENGRRQSRGSVNLAALGQVIAMLALAVAFSCGSAQANDKKKDNPADFTRVFALTYDEVFQASRQALLRQGWNVTDADKDKGTIRGIVISDEVGGNNKNEFEVHVEVVSSKPETRAAINVTVHHTMMLNDAEVRRWCASHFFTELQKVLATYQ